MDPLPPLLDSLIRSDGSFNGCAILRTLCRLPDVASVAASLQHTSRLQEGRENQHRVTVLFLNYIIEKQDLITTIRPDLARQLFEELHRHESHLESYAECHSAFLVHRLLLARLLPADLASIQPTSHIALLAMSSVAPARTRQFSMSIQKELFSDVHSLSAICIFLYR
jgi:hypothetical protein